MKKDTYLNSKNLKHFTMMFILIFTISCNYQNTDKENIIASNPYLIGKWTGNGNFFDVELNEEFGLVTFEIEIKGDNSIFVEIGEAKLINTSISEAKYGYEIKGELDSKLKNGSNLDKDHLIILLVLPDENRKDATRSDANFHLKSNYTFDFSMHVGGVNLTKELE